MAGTKLWIKNMNQKNADKFEIDAERYANKVCKSKEAARACLVRVGIYNKDGTLHKNYGG